jgi:hypothetical protein
MNDGDVIHYTGIVHILSDIQSKPVIPTDANGHSVTNVVSVSLLSPYGLGSCRVNRILWLVKVKINPWLLWVRNEQAVSFGNSPRLCNRREQVSFAQQLMLAKPQSMISSI